MTTEPLRHLSPAGYLAFERRAETRHEYAGGEVFAMGGAEDLQVLRVYRRLSDDAAESKGFLRVIDESGEDYLYPESWFLALPLPPALEEKLEAVAAERSRVEIA